MSFVAPNPSERLTGSPEHFDDLNPAYEEDIVESPEYSDFLNVSYQGTGKNFVVEAAGSLDFHGTHFSKPDPETYSQVKLITNIAQRDLEATFNNDGLIRLWTNFGTLVSPNLRNISAKVKTDTTFRRVSYAAGFQWNYHELDFSTRLHVKADSEPFLNQEVAWGRDNIQVDAAFKFSLATFLFSRINILGSYSYKNYVFSLKQNFFENSSSVLAALYRGKRHTSVFKASFAHRKQHLDVKGTLGTVYRVDDRTTLRARINTDGDLATSASYIVNNNLKVSIGSQVNVTEPSSFSTTTVIPVPLGISLDFKYN